MTSDPVTVDTTAPVELISPDTAPEPVAEVPLTTPKTPTPVIPPTPIETPIVPKVVRKKTAPKPITPPSSPSLLSRLKPVHYGAIGLVLALAILIGVGQGTKQSPIISPLAAPILTATPSATLAPSPTKSALYPIQSLTPGASFPNVTAQQVCQPDYATSVRAVPEETKKAVFLEYGISYPQQSGVYEVDHFIPLELGGSNDIKNLWPEPASPTPGFHQKDMVEDALRSQVCAGKLSLTDAQREITTDWHKVYLSL